MNRASVLVERLAYRKYTGQVLKIRALRTYSRDARLGIGKTGKLYK